MSQDIDQFISETLTAIGQANPDVEAVMQMSPLDSHFKCDTELLSEGLDWRLESEAFSRG